MRQFLGNSQVTTPSATSRIGALFEREFGGDVTSKLQFCHHHLAHLWSAFHPSGFERGLVVSLDGNGDGFSGMVAQGSEEGIATLRRFPDQKSLGHFYNLCIGFLGYRRFDEYKAMGLSPLRRSGALPEVLREPIPAGSGRRLRVHLARATAEERSAGWSLSRSAAKRAAAQTVPQGLAASLQEALERIVLHVLGHFRELTGERNLCLSGGGRSHSSMNGRILTEGGFEKVFAQPAAHDAGNALGAALFAYHSARRKVTRRPLRRMQLGPTIVTGRALEDLLKGWGDLITFRRSPAIEEKKPRR